MRFLHTAPRRKRAFYRREGGASNRRSHLGEQREPETFYLCQLMPRKLDLDLAYRERVSFREDLRLIFLTLAQLFRWKPGAQVHT